MLNDIAEGLFSVIGRALMYIFVEIFLEIVFYFIGYPIVKIVTLGKFPKPKTSLLNNDGKHQDGWVGFVGILVIAAGVLAALIF